MPESVYKVIELIGTSNESWEKAAIFRIAEPAVVDGHIGSYGHASIRP